jgi:hypothetical protein
MAVNEEFKKGVVKEVEGWKGRLMMYLQDEETVKVLVPPTQVRPAISSVTVPHAYAAL